MNINKRYVDYKIRELLKHIQDAATLRGILYVFLIRYLFECAPQLI